MKTAVAESSIANYKRPDTQLRFDGIKGRIIAAMEFDRNYTRREISRMLDIDYSCASGRVRELIEAGALIEPGTSLRGYKGREVGVVTLSMAAA